MRPEDRLNLALARLQTQEKQLKTALRNAEALAGENTRLGRELKDSLTQLAELKAEITDLQKKLAELEKSKTRSRKPKAPIKSTDE